MNIRSRTSGSSLGNALGNSIVGAVQYGQIQQEAQALDERGKAVFNEIVEQTGNEQVALDYARRVSGVASQGTANAGGFDAGQKATFALSYYENSGQLLEDLGYALGDGTKEIRGRSK